MWSARPEPRSPPRYAEGRAVQQGPRHRERLHRPPRPRRRPRPDPQPRRRAVRPPPRHRRRRRAARRPLGRARRGADARRRASSGSWTTATPTAASPRCAATACGCSPATSPTAAGCPRGSCGSAPGAGSARVHVKDDEVAVDMGPVRVDGEAKASVDGQRVPRPHRERRATRTWPASSTCRSASLDLTRPPGHDPSLFPHGVNVEFVRRSSVNDASRCACTSAAWERPARAARARSRRWSPRFGTPGRETGTVAVDTPGGPLRVTVDEATTTLHGPAELVAHGELDPRWWDGTV